MLDCPVIVENNVRSMALAESLFGLGRQVGSLAFVYSRIGVGAGFIVGGNIFRGSGAGAGEMGHTTILPESGETCTCGNAGCLETLVSEPALLRKTQDYVKSHPSSPLAKHLQETEKPLSAEAVFHAAHEGDEGLRPIIEDQARYLGIALANLVNVMNPELILLGGIFAQGKDFILPVADEVMRQRSFGGLGENVRLDITSFGWRAGPIGAASVALASTFYHEAVAA
jgi:predicted NBD/HSP70 family sugar kinase